MMRRVSVTQPPVGRQESRVPTEGVAHSEGRDVRSVTPTSATRPTASVLCLVTRTRRLLITHTP